MDGDCRWYRWTAINWSYTRRKTIWNALGPLQVSSSFGDWVSCWPVQFSCSGRWITMHYPDYRSNRSTTVMRTGHWFTVGRYIHLSQSCYSTPHRFWSCRSSTPRSAGVYVCITLWCSTFVKTGASRPPRGVGYVGSIPCWSLSPSSSLCVGCHSMSLTCCWIPTTPSSPKTARQWSYVPNNYSTNNCWNSNFKKLLR